jgi:hypothetical protein
LEEGLWQLPPKPPVTNYEITLKLNFHHLFEPLYQPSQADLKASEELVDNNLEERFI